MEDSCQFRYGCWVFVFGNSGFCSPDGMDTRWSPAVAEGRIDAYIGLISVDKMYYLAFGIYSDNPRWQLCSLLCGAGGMSSMI